MPNWNRHKDDPEWYDSDGGERGPGAILWLVIVTLFCAMPLGLACGVAVFANLGR